MKNLRKISTDVRTNYSSLLFYPECDKLVIHFVKNCHIHFKFKTYTKLYNGFLKDCRCSSRKKILIKFVSSLFKINDFDAILIMSIVFPNKNNNLFQHQNWPYAYRIHGILDSIIFDKNTQFVNEFQKKKFRLKINKRLQIIYHAKIND